MHEPGSKSPGCAEGSATAQAVAGGPEQTEAPAATKPYLRVFGPDVGAFEYELPERIVTIGRSPEADIQLPNPRVSRAHATVSFQDGQFILEDAGSTGGTVLNGQAVKRHELRHGDTIQIGMYLLEFRAHRALPGAAQAAARAKLLLRSEFCLLPSSIRMKYRSLSVAPQEVFRPGDTLKIGYGGVLVPTPVPPDDSACLELELTWPSGASRRYLGEVVGVIEEQGLYWACTKLHSVPKHMHEATVAAGALGEWVEVPAS